MKIILSSPIPGEIAQLKDMLENAGIACFTRNEVLAGLSPEVPLSESTPELRIRDDHQLAKALEIKRAWKASVPVGGGDWVCPTCGETSEPQFSSCWKCGTARKEDQIVHWCTKDELQRSEPATTSPDNEEIVEGADGGIICVSCGKRIEINAKYCPFCDYTQPYKAAV